MVVYNGIYIPYIRSWYNSWWKYILRFLKYSWKKNFHPLQHLNSPFMMTLLQSWNHHLVSGCPFSQCNFTRSQIILKYDFEEKKNWEFFWKDPETGTSGSVLAAEGNLSLISGGGNKKRDGKSLLSCSLKKVIERDADVLPTATMVKFVNLMVNKLVSL